MAEPVAEIGHVRAIGVDAVLARQRSDAGDEGGNRDRRRRARVRLGDQPVPLFVEVQPRLPLVAARNRPESAYTLDSRKLRPVPK